MSALPTSPTPLARGGERAFHTLRQPRILLVEDNPADARLTLAALTAATQPVDHVWVRTLSSAVSELRRAPFDCVLLDPNLPDCDGLEGLDRLLEAQPALAVVVLTGDDSAALGAQAVEHGAQDHLHKSELTTALLIRTVEYATGRARTQAGLHSSESHHRAVFNALAEGVLVYGRNGHIVSVNPTAARILGCTESEMVGLRPHGGSLSLLDEHGAPLAHDQFPSTRSFATGEPIAGVVLGIPRDADITWIEANATPLVEDAGDRPYAVVVSFRDITERQLAAEQLRASEFRHRLLLANAAEGYALIGPDGELVAAFSALDTLGPLQDLDGSAFLRRVHPDDIDRALATRRAAARTPGVPQHVELRAMGPDGTHHWLEVAVTSWLHEPAVGGFVINFREISERKRAQEAIAFQARLLNAAGQAIIATDPAGAIVFWNKAAEEMYGYTAAEVMGRPIVEVTPTEETAEQGAEIMAALTRGGSWSGDFWVRRRDGSRFPAFVTDTPVFDDRGDLVAIIGVSADITDRRRAEEAARRLSAIVESSAEAIIGLDAEGLVTSWNRAAEDLYRCPAAEALGCHIDALVGGDFGLEALGPGDAVLNEVTVHARKDGTTFDVSVTISPTADTDGVVVGRSLIARDITDRLRTARAVAESRRQLEEAQRVAGMGSFEFDVATDTLSWSDELYRLLGLDDSRHPSEPLYLQHVHPEDRPDIEGRWVELFAHGKDFDTTHRMVRANGHVLWVRTRAVARHDDDGQLVAVSGMTLNVTEQVRAENLRAAAEMRFSVGFDGAAIGTVIADLDGRPLRVNPAMCALLGRSEAELNGSTWVTFSHPDEKPLFVCAAAALATGQTSYSDERRYVRPNGQVVWALVSVTLVREETDAAYYFAQFQDITDRKRMEKALEEQALHDSLTGLPNRKLIADRLEQARARARRTGGGVTVMFLDLDRFKFVNDSLGHAAGDRLLAKVGHRLQEAARPGDTVGRFGGDEFVVVCDGLSDDCARGVGDRLLRALAAPFFVDQRELFVSASLGITHMGPDDSTDSALRDADAAMYLAKERGRGRAEVFDEALRDRVVARLDLESDLRRAMQRGEFELHYQPVLALGSGRVLGLEALLRWHHPDRGMVSPADFIPLAEDTGLIVSLGAWVLEEAVRQLAVWRSSCDGCEDLWVAVNVSASQLTRDDLVDFVTGLAWAHGLPCEAIHLEITESVLMADVAAGQDALEGLHAAGVRLSIDDFGTGYSSLSYLKRFPVSALKIDRSFVSGLGDNSSDASIVRAIVSVGHALELDVIAEGVETDEQRIALQKLGCDSGQGYLWSRPLPAHAIPSRLTARQWKEPVTP